MRRMFEIIVGKRAYQIRSFLPVRAELWDHCTSTGRRPFLWWTRDSSESCRTFPEVGTRPSRFLGSCVLSADTLGQSSRSDSCNWGKNLNYLCWILSRIKQKGFYYNKVAYVNPNLFSWHRPPLWQGLLRQDSLLVKFLAPQVHSASTSTRTPTSDVLFAFTMYGRLLISRVLVQLPSHAWFSYRHSSIPTIVMLTPTSFSI